MAKAFGISEEELRHARELPEDQLLTPDKLTEIAVWAAKRVSDYSMRCTGIASAATDQQLKTAFAKQAKDADLALSRLVREVAVLARFHAPRTECEDLLTDAVVHCVSVTEDLPELWRKFEEIAGPEEFGPEEVENLPWLLAERLIGLVKFLEDQCEKHPERFRLLAREYPHWPFLVTPHKAGYRKRYERITGLIELGTECPLEATSPSAGYRLETPVCGLLWEEVFLDWLAVSAGVRMLRRRARLRNQGVDPDEETKEIEQAVTACCKTEGERKIFRDAFALPPLCKGTSRQWADGFVIPYLQFKYPDWQRVPALEKFLGKKGGVVLAVREIRRALRAMARA